MVAGQEPEAAAQACQWNHSAIWSSLYGLGDPLKEMSLPNVPDDDSVTFTGSADSWQTTASFLSAASLPATAEASRRNTSEPPKRLVDFFCVIGAQVPVHETKQVRFKKVGNEHYLHLEPSLVDCYPKTRPDMEFPKHLSDFCFPNGCRAIRMGTEIPDPILWTLVLTSASGHRLYGAVLTMYDETINTRQQQEEQSGRHSSNDQRKDKEAYYVPKCLVVLSHYAFFDVFRKFLQQLYRIFKSRTSPLPLERFIANFCNDVPLPPTGRAVVKWECFTMKKFVEIARPPPNQLPLVNFSYEPLFRTLSVANVLVVWGVLLSEGRVALYSKHLSLLTPVAEALLSLLFPLEWQGIYIPVLPWGMLDVLDAPVPYFVGFDQRCWKKNKYRRPSGVVFVDLDEDIVHLGWNDDYTEEENLMPDLPDGAAMELRVLLEELTDHLFLVPACGIKGRITTANDQILDNSVREPYAQMTRLHDGRRSRKSRNHRKFILSTAGNAFVGEDILQPLKSSDFVLSREQRVTRKRFVSPTPTVADSDSSAVLSLKRATRRFQAHTDRLLAYAGQKYATPNPFNTSEAERVLRGKRFQLATNFYEVDVSGNDNNNNSVFSTPAIRKAFLSFLVHVLFRYKKFLRVGVNREVTMDRDAFIRDLSLSTSNKQYVMDLVGTQMFERFIHDRGPRRAFFDEQIITVKNRSSLFALNQQPTPFLDDTQWDVRKTIRPKTPCTKGVQRGTTYRFEKFPKLDEKELIPSDDDGFFSELWRGSLCSVCLCWPAW